MSVKISNDNFYTEAKVASLSDELVKNNGLNVYQELADYIYYTKIEVDNNAETYTLSLSSDEPLRFKSFDTTSEILEASSHYTEGEVVYNKQINAPCVRTSTGWSSFNTTSLQ